ncbi:MAG TPA: metal-sensing transcriptional repressor [Nocardioidaceae bacterium]|nr:metal-sensing transcriptional repressor [Nocardioidaceae bacterium]
MVGAGRDCADIITQLTAAAHALDRVGFLLVAGELRRCAASASAADAEERLAAVEKLFVRLG